MKGSHDGWLGFKEGLVMNDIAQSFLALCQGAVAVAVGVEAFPEFGAGFDLLWIFFGGWKDFGNLFPVCVVAFHYSFGELRTRQ